MAFLQGTDLISRNIRPFRITGIPQSVLSNRSWKNYANLDIKRFFSVAKNSDLRLVIAPEDSGRASQLWPPRELILPRIALPTVGFDRTVTPEEYKVISIAFGD